MKNIMITTQHRGVFLGKAEEDADLTSKTLTGIHDLKMLIRWRGGKGLFDVAENGPSVDCLISSQVYSEVIHDVTAVFQVTNKAAEKIWN